ncbi:hypothetical protein [Janthinobacterium sp.]|uniref:hypothetical protein n=1 Tax=Janthinobacterium sp. TaxID=1871054 RepID=UPI0025C583CB|nr:hypothetical protein [Janthinobacterium sp.]
MPLLGQLLVHIITFLISFFGRFMVAEKAFRVSAVVIFVGLAATLLTTGISCVRGVCAQGISGISSLHPNFAVGLGIAFNGTTMAAASCYVSVWLACQIYVINKKGINLVAK